MMTGLVFLADSLDIANRHINASASQHIQPDGNLTFAIDIDQFTNQPGQRSFHQHGPSRHVPKESCSYK